MFPLKVTANILGRGVDVGDGIVFSSLIVQVQLQLLLGKKEPGCKDPARVNSTDHNPAMETKSLDKVTRSGATTIVLIQLF